MPAARENKGLVGRYGPIEVDWPRSVGYFGAIAIGVACEVIEPPLALFIAAVPFVKMLNLPRASWPVRLVAQLADGASTPVGGSSEQTVRLTTSDVQTAAHQVRPGTRRRRSAPAARHGDD